MYGKSSEHILRKWCSKAHRFTGDWMIEGEFMRVKRLSGNIFHIRIVQIVTNQRIAKVLHVNSYLMGAACF